MSNVLVIAEQNNAVLAGGTLNTIAAAAQLAKAAGGSVDVLIAGEGVKAAADAAAKIEGVAKVLLADAPAYAHGLAEPLAALVAGVAKNYAGVLVAATTFGKNVAPRVAALLDVQQISEITGIVSADTFVRPFYAGNAVATVQSKDPIKVVTVRATAFDPVKAEGGSAAVEALAPAADPALSTFVGQELVKSERPDLGAARVVVAGGRGMGSAENFKLIEALADKLGGAVGATRAAVDAEYCAHEIQVGQTGKIIAPELYIAAGISGAIQHTAGVKDSKVIVAINKDEEATIFQIADYGLVGDAVKILPELIDALGK